MNITLLTICEQYIRMIRRERKRWNIIFGSNYVLDDYCSVWWNTVDNHSDKRRSDQPRVLLLPVICALRIRWHGRVISCRVYYDDMIRNAGSSKIVLSTCISDSIREAVAWCGWNVYLCLDCVRLDELFYIVEDVQLYEEGVKQNVRGLVRDSNPGPRAP